MSASEEFPRGVTMQAQTSGTAASVSFPSFAGSWVITDVVCKIVNTNTGAGLIASVVDSASTRIFMLLAASEATASSTGVDSDNWGGKIEYPYGVAPTFSVNASQTGASQNLAVTGYPI